MRNSALNAGVFLLPCAAPHAVKRESMRTLPKAARAAATRWLVQTGAARIPQKIKSKIKETTIRCPLGFTLQPLCFWQRYSQYSIDFCSDNRAASLRVADTAFGRFLSKDFSTDDARHPSRNSGKNFIMYRVQ